MNDIKQKVVELLENFVEETEDYKTLKLQTDIEDTASEIYQEAFDEIANGQDFNLKQYVEDYVKRTFITDEDAFSEYMTIEKFEAIKDNYNLKDLIDSVYTIEDINEKIEYVSGNHNDLVNEALFEKEIFGELKNFGDDFINILDYFDKDKFYNEVLKHSYTETKNGFLLDNSI